MKSKIKYRTVFIDKMIIKYHTQRKLKQNKETRNTFLVEYIVKQGEEEEDTCQEIESA